MKTIHFSGTRQAAGALVMTVVAWLSANGQGGTINLTNRTLQKTTIQVGTDYTGVECLTSGCNAEGVVFTRPVGCPGAAGKTCTFYLLLEGQAFASPGDYGYFKFLVDGVAPVGGRIAEYQTYVDRTNAAAVVAKVKNTSANQLHTIEVDLGCDDVSLDYCSASMSFHSLVTSVYTP